MDTMHPPAFPLLVEFPRFFRLLARALEFSAMNDKKALTKKQGAVTPALTSTG